MFDQEDNRQKKMLICFIVANIFRSKLQMFFSFAYSPEDVYLQRADMENLVYDIDDALNNNCPVRFLHVIPVLT